MGTKTAKGAVVAASSAAAIGLAAPTSSAANEDSWYGGCRGYWYTTAGHGYCYNAKSPSASPGLFMITYDCNYEVDEQRFKTVKDGFMGKFDSYECTFKINRTTVRS
ncbi:hypothetical protein [Streptomyces purpureus]|uniref:Secreted protein n=1 Tax=Streptomyces purpureus TaxID=1951 RepID=A0A918HA94_9ACTN|nr:hypothetical protein [Streptomyces purpureus]GGT47876.1 hypothetical protein GCM10014713_47470 [Streptomyces purpureus]